MFIECPHCYQLIEVIELNCRIFRCGIIKATYEQIPPHATKDECIKYLNDGIYGCAKPFIINNNLIPEKCDYI
jgi:hypothetical protein